MIIGKLLLTLVDAIVQYFISEFIEKLLYCIIYLT